MVSKKVLEDENKSWHEDHVNWIDEVALWQHETQHLVALLYLLT